MAGHGVNDYGRRSGRVGSNFSMCNLVLWRGSWPSNCWPIHCTAVSSMSVLFKVIKQLASVRWRRLKHALIASKFVLPQHQFAKACYTTLPSSNDHHLEYRVHQLIEYTKTFKRKLKTILFSRPITELIFYFSSRYVIRWSILFCKRNSLWTMNYELQSR